MCLSLAAGVVLVACNIILGIFGIILALVGVLKITMPWVLYNLATSLEFIEQIHPSSVLPEELMESGGVFVQPGATLVIFGLSILLVSIFGACSSVCGGICRIVYSVLVAAFILGLSLFIAYESSSAGRRQFKKSVEHGLMIKFNESLSPEGSRIWNLYEGSSDPMDLHLDAIKGNLLAGNISKPSAEEAWFFYQSMMSCCGVNSYKDYKGNVSRSCCQQIQPGKVPNDTTAYTNYTRCREENSTEYLNREGCLTDVYAQLALLPQLGTMLSSLGVFLLAICLAISAYLMG